MADRTGTPRIVERTWLASTILLLAVLFVVGAQGFSGDAAHFPTVVGTLTALLAAAELMFRLRDRSPAQDQIAGSDLNRKLLLGGWALITLSSFYGLGVIATIMISATLYFYVFVWRRLIWSIAAGLGHALFFWIAFELLAGFRLYQGVLD